MISLNITYADSFVPRQSISEMIEKNTTLIKSVLDPDTNSIDLGWVNIEDIADEALISNIEEMADLIRSRADVFVLIGIGGSNQGARAVLEALRDDAVKIVYSGNTLSPVSMSKVMSKLKDKSIYANVIAKNFATLEPGVAFRTIRHYMEDTYGSEEAAKRIIATGSLNDSLLERLGKEKGYKLLPFPLNVGGRFSVLSAVGLLPLAVGGVNIRELLKGAADMKTQIQSDIRNIAVQYAVYRNLLLQKGYVIEIMSSFEPMLNWFSKWWVQLFGESEGKDGQGIFPTQCSFSEDLHSLGQYIQDGRRMLFETFLNLEDCGESFMLPHEEGNRDGFAYIDGKDFKYLNKIAYDATIKAHDEGGVPCMAVNIPKLSPYYFGQLFYFFEYACYISGSILGVNPFNQPGVEAYKKNMFGALGKLS